MRRMLLVVCVLAGCPSEPPPACLPTVDTTCAPGYVPTFTNVYANTIHQSCGTDQSSCHSASGRAGGLSMETQDAAYANLMANGRVKPDDPACSKMIVRTDSPGKDYQMPPGDPISAEERCALIQWVQMGAMP
ncbi:MAG TPA: c-type cytochrome domain-containing protein [Kofleriaceae bacterium]|nr:c-type cytochrome domain-containing protein [Kofleriaceae bacterium]